MGCVSIDAMCMQCMSALSSWEQQVSCVLIGICFKKAAVVSRCLLVNQIFPPG